MTSMEKPQGNPTPEKSAPAPEENVLADKINALKASVVKKTKELSIVGAGSSLGKEIQGQIDAANIELVVATNELRTTLAMQELERDIKEQKGDAKYTVAKPPATNSKTMGKKDFTDWHPGAL